MFFFNDLALSGGFAVLHYKVDRSRAGSEPQSAEELPRQTLDVTRKLSCYLSFLLLVVRPGAPNSVLAPSSDARSP